MIFGSTTLGDVIRGLGGRDTIHGYGGNDTVHGGDGRLFGDAGNDSLDGGFGSDSCAGGAGATTGLSASAERPLAAALKPERKRPGWQWRVGLVPVTGGRCDDRVRTWAR
ncbi:MAG: hypothetical protein H0U09_07730 [Geodermatophilaceae bacterium]|nr:hypothetical protein [Geodermatophilaceae bacterium]